MMNSIRRMIQLKGSKQGFNKSFSLLGEKTYHRTAVCANGHHALPQVRRRLAFSPSGETASRQGFSERSIGTSETTLRDLSQTRIDIF